MKRQSNTIHSTRGGLFCILLICILFLNVSCFNSLQEDPQLLYFSPVTTNAVITGNLSIGDNFGRTVFPSVPSGAGYTWYAKATPAGSTTPIAGSVPDTHDSYSISNLSIGVVYTIEVGIKNSSNKTLLIASHTMDDDEVLTTEAPVYSHDFVLMPVQTTSGKGTISLTIEILSDSNIRNYSSSNKNGIFDVLGDSITITENNVAAGSKSIDFYFYDNLMNLIYSFSETVNVYDNMTTSEWVRNGGTISSPHLVDVTETVGGVTTTVTKCRITKALVDSFKMRTFYVKSGGNNSNSGTYFSPLATLEGAALKMKDSNIDYTIFIIGELTGNQQLVNNYAANSITLCGYNDGSGLLASLKGNGNDSVLHIETDTPVLIKNLKITNGVANTSTNYYGGGINFVSGTVKLTNGTVITGNDAKYGGGVYVASGAKLYIYDSALIGDDPDNTNLPSGISNANQAEYGGGIYNEGAVYLGYSDYTDATHYTLANIPQGYGIRRNYVQNSEYSNPKGGGGIYNAGTLMIASGELSYNSASGSGGGIYNTASASLTMKDGLIKGNYSAAGGGGISNASSSASVILEGGRLESNSANLGAGAIENSGTFKIKGAVSIPYGGSQKQNDITPYSPITLSDNFSTHSSTEKIAITYLANTYFVRGKKLFDADTGVSITSTVLSNFQITEADWNLVPYNSNSEGRLDAEVWVAGSSDRDSSVGSPSGSNTGTKSKPVNSIATAITRIENSEWPSAKNWTIKINGTVKGAQAISGSFSKINGITLDGLDGKTNELDGDFTGGSKGCTLTITAGIDVSIYDITITGGKNTNTSAKGGGIYINNGTKSVYIDGATITENTAYQGGGIYVEAGDLHLIDGIISSNTASNAGGAVFAAADINHGGAIEIPHLGAPENNDIYLSGTSKIINDYSFSSEVGISLPDSRCILNETLITREEYISTDTFESNLSLYQLLGTDLFSVVYKENTDVGAVSIDFTQLQEVSAITNYMDSKTWTAGSTYIKRPEDWEDDKHLFVLLKKDNNNYAVVEVYYSNYITEYDLYFDYVSFKNSSRTPGSVHKYFTTEYSSNDYGANVLNSSPASPDIFARLVTDSGWDLRSSYSWYLIE